MLKIINISLLSIFVIFQVRLFYGESSIFTILSYYKKIEQKKQELSILESKNNALIQKIKYIKNNAAAIEELARYRLGMVKKNETYYQVVELVE